MESRTERELIRIMWLLLKEITLIREALEADYELTVEKDGEE